MNIRKITAWLMALTLLLTAIPTFEVPALAASMPYKITVDLTNQIVTIFSTETDEVVRQMLCSSGAKDATPTGEFTMPQAERSGERKEWFHFNAFGGYARYASRIYKDVMFHSLLYNRPNLSALNKQSVLDYGKAVSHGCIRMRWQDAEFIAKNCLPGTRVKIYKSGNRDEDLRLLLLQASYTNENGQSYQAFLGIPDEEGVLGRYSEGEEVRDLQMRLRDLGIYSDMINGVYQVSTVTAVREAQSLLGMEQTGAATVAFRDAIYASDAPSAMDVILKDGMSGPAVRSLQQNLAALLLYSGDIDSVYDIDVTEAVKAFQGAYGYTADGVASPEVQRAIYYEAGRIRKLFEDEGSYSLQKVDEQIQMGTVNPEMGVRLREEKSLKSKKLTLLKRGEWVVVLDKGSDWSRVQKGNDTGYVKTEYIDFFSQTISSLRYASDSGSAQYTIGCTAQDYYTGADRPADRFSDYLASGGSLDDYDDLIEYATVSTGDDSLNLNLRAEPSTESDIQAALPNGTQVRVTRHAETWSLVDCGGTQGYLLNQYLEFWNGGEHALDGAVNDADVPELEIDDDAEIEHAVVACDSADKAPVFDEDSADANLLGNLKNGVQVDVLETIDGWSHISYQDHEGYMREQDLRFVVDGTQI